MAYIAHSSPTASHRAQIRTAVRITVTGTVQGVGFRPFVYRLANNNHISGRVANTAAGVKIHAAGNKTDLDAFIDQLKQAPPPLAEIDSFVVAAAEEPDDNVFRIVESSATEEKTVILPPDISLCDDCRRELFDPADRRYRYPLNNCTNCGPRYTIIRNLPYDRPQTAMSPFPLCPDCLAEYRDPQNRRFHAEATSCPNCGPALRLLDPQGAIIATKNPIAWLAEKINRGHIVAVQGLGGFHIICDATDDQAVAALRRRKNRPHKPFAVMVKNAAMAQAYGRFDEAGLTLLNSPRRPVVIVPERRRCSKAVSGGLDRIGLFLPYTPLHLLLFEYLEGPIVATSANISAEPIITDGKTLRARLGSVIDYCLEFEREIINGCDGQRGDHGGRPAAVVAPGTRLRSGGAQSAGGVKSIRPGGRRRHEEHHRDRPTGQSDSQPPCGQPAQSRRPGLFRAHHHHFFPALRLHPRTHRL